MMAQKLRLRMKRNNNGITRLANMARLHKNVKTKMFFSGQLEERWASVDESLSGYSGSLSAVSHLGTRHSFGSIDVLFAIIRRLIGDVSPLLTSLWVQTHRENR